MASSARTPPHPVRRVAAACALALGTLLVLPATPAAAWTEGPCPDRTGITVVVDFAGFRDQTIVRCAPDGATSGFGALQAVDIDYDQPGRFPGMICRIEGLPADEPCMNAPPADAYWGYWRAEYGGSWRYSNYGPGTTSPAPGPVEGWRFSTGDDQPPRVAPPPPPAPAAAPEPTSSPSRTPEPTSSPAAPPPAAAPTTAPTPDPSAAPESADDTATTTPSPTESTDPIEAPATTDPSPDADPTSDAPTGLATTPAATATHLDGPAAATDPADDDGPPVATLLGVALVAFVGGGAVWVDRRRKRS